jgi:hypothetical protein
VGHAGCETSLAAARSAFGNVARSGRGGRAVRPTDRPHAGEGLAGGSQCDGRIAGFRDKRPGPRDRRTGRGFIGACPD